MSKGEKRAASMLRACPKCGAAPGVACTGSKGPRIAQHQARHAGVTKKVLAKIASAQANVRAGKAEDFYRSDAWRVVRYKALTAHGGVCQCCGARASLGRPLHVDHIKPRSLYPDLQLEISNLQVLCDDCNLGKGARDQTDWRPTAAVGQ